LRNAEADAGFGRDDIDAALLGFEFRLAEIEAENLEIRRQRLMRNGTEADAQLQRREFVS
jgi:hypothetical protein